MDTLPATRLPAQGSAPVKPQVSRPYANVAMALHSSRLGGPLPLPPGRQTPPPTGWTGATGKYPSGADVAEWIDGQPDGNVAVRLADGVVGIDVDQYPTAGKHKVGGQSLAAAENHLGPLPPTFWSTSRADGVSGIRLFRVPLGTVLVSQFSTARLGADVEVIQRHHRYAVVAPSVHPDGRTYRWIGPDGVDLHDGEVPSVDDLADLPPAWVEALSVDSSRAALGAEIISPPSEWPTAPRSHPYVAVMVSALATDTRPAPGTTGSTTPATAWLPPHGSGSSPPTTSPRRSAPCWPGCTPRRTAAAPTRTPARRPTARGAPPSSGPAA